MCIVFGLRGFQNVVVVLLMLVVFTLFWNENVAQNTKDLEQVDQVARQAMEDWKTQQISAQLKSVENEDEQKNVKSSDESSDNPWFDWEEWGEKSGTRLNIRDKQFRTNLQPKLKRNQKPIQPNTMFFATVNPTLYSTENNLQEFMKSESIRLTNMLRNAHLPATLFPYQDSFVVTVHANAEALPVAKFLLDSNRISKVVMSQNEYFKDSFVSESEEESDSEL
mmetsp:Transcript_7284/g.13145  ORF Transcript_7284/g.13145 Transcript_7284/m.13145 type:complete len:223 (-) Transcript_7284:95-763(-)|eukprot:CAMPEP_0182450470 /NCGR_PEP_ID=MMETSP1172-20130603/41442_1 /TAXON_ID=708627 /ORGANISM="Timspurckia oligopyrenoides, Strain CCMP3278" /LENGTH=222 /DNA_ID=CAMNT_0024648085 /DNA_START=58 /DNA_END=726 /DNA_ORIENTATION=-